MVKIAFVGLGNMGGPIAMNLIKAKYEFTVFDLDQTKAHNLIEQGAKWGETIASTVQHADIVMTSLPNPSIIQSVAFEKKGILNSMKKNATWIELSTNNLEVLKTILEKVKEKELFFLDAPISGGIEGAAKGDLTIMVGGEQQVFDQHLEIFKIIGEDIKRVGGHGAGYVAKISQVVLCYLHSVALSEALMLGAKGGVDIETMLSIIQNSTGRSYVADRYGPALLDGSYDPGFLLGLAHKDMKLTLELAQSVSAKLPMCNLVETIYATATDKYGADQNHLSAIRLLEEANEMFLRK